MMEDLVEENAAPREFETYLTGTSAPLSRVVACRLKINNKLPIERGTRRGRQSKMHHLLFNHII